MCESKKAIKLLILTKKIQKSPVGGRELLSKVNYDALSELYGVNFYVYQLPATRLRGARAVLNAFRSHIDGLDTDTIFSICNLIQREAVSKVFVDGSNLGGFVRVLKHRLPEVEISTFFHNVEARFFAGAMLASKHPRAVGVLLANYLAERQAVRYSDNILCLSLRDSRLLKKLYGRGSTHVTPMALKDKYPKSNAAASMLQSENFALFVGGTFYANRDGINWFVKEVVPHIDIPLYIVGRGFEALRSELEVPGKVVVVGAVDSLADWYRRARFIVAPIFDGSGMKTKVAEALMFGKKVIGTPEAFSGYEDVVERAGFVCSTADEFVTTIARAQQEAIPAFDGELRALYEQKYSLLAARNRLSVIFGTAE